MHILVTNDDGPPSPQSSPYVHCLVRHLERAGHIVSVCVPNTQRSWIGKAHMIGQTLRPFYYRPSERSHGNESEGTTHNRPSPSGDTEEWILIDGTPASCVQIGLHHFFQNKGPIDLVVSGPNYGRNTTAAFALSSGTLGAALEAAVCNKKAIALSFAFFSRNHDPAIIEGACRHSVKVIDALYKQWPTDKSADLYSVNVPLVEGVETHKTLWTDMLQNYWRNGSCFQEVEGDVGDESEQEEMIREGPGGEMDGDAATPSSRPGHTHKHFKWSPRFTDVYKSVEEAPPGNDGWAVKEGYTSVTPLKANFAAASGAPEDKEFKLHQDIEEATTGTGKLTNKKGVEHDPTPINAIISYEDPYVQPLVVSAAHALMPDNLLTLTTELPTSEGGDQLLRKLPSGESGALQIVPYEHIDFEFAAEHTKTCLINSYMIRKALIRKHYLSTTADHWVAKNPGSVLKSHVQRSEAFEVDYAEFLDDALIEAFDLRESMDRNAEIEGNAASAAGDRQWWILKPGMSDRGQGIRLFSTMDELQGIFDAWEEDRPDSDDEAESDEEDEAMETQRQPSGDYITASHLRHFVAQPYIHPPLLLEGENRKFHIRTYVLCVGSLSVYVYKHMLALFAAKPYTAPWEAPDDIESFLTNTCLQDSPNENSVRRFWDLPLAATKLVEIFKQICDVSGELFEAAARAMPIHFQTMPNAFEVFGLDFLLDAQGSAWLLEVNAFPDFKQTGGDLEDVVGGFWKGVFCNAVLPFFNIEPEINGDSSAAREDMVLARRIDLGRR